MTVRVTVRLPESVYERLKAAGASSRRSLNQVIVDALRGAGLSDAPPEGATPQELLNWALRDIAVPWTDEMDELMAEVFGDDDAPLLSHEELQAAFPPVTPPLSETIIEMREDRF